MAHAEFDRDPLNNVAVHCIINKERDKPNAGAAEQTYQTEAKRKITFLNA